MRLRRSIVCKIRGVALASVCVPFDDKAAHAHGSQQQRGEGADWTATHDDDIDDGLDGLSVRHCHVTVTALASLLLAEWNAAAECHMYASNKRESAARLHRRRAKALAHRSVALRFYRRRATRARAGTNTNVTTSGGGGVAG